MYRMTLLIISLFSFSAAASDWELSKSDAENAIHIYTREAKGSSLQEFRGELVVNSRLTALVALVEDSKSAPQWLDQCQALEVVEDISDYEKVFYMVMDAPWPISDRDSVFRSILSQDKTTGVVHIRMTSEPDSFPDNKDYLRIKNMTGYWEFIPQGGGEIKVIYQVFADPGGGIPVWLANSVIVDNPYNTLKNMANLVKKPRYQQAELKNIIPFD